MNLTFDFSKFGPVSSHSKRDLLVTVVNLDTAFITANGLTLAESHNYYATTIVENEIQQQRTPETSL